MPVQKNHLDVDILSVFVKKVFQKVRHRLIGDVSTNHDVPAKKYSVICKLGIFQKNLTMSVLHARSGVVLTLIYQKKKQNLAYLTFVKEKTWLMLNLVKLETSNGKEEQGRRPHNTTLIRT